MFWFSISLNASLQLQYLNEKHTSNIIVCFKFLLKIRLKYLRIQNKMRNRKLKYFM